MKRNKPQIVAEYLRGDTSYRELAKKHGVSHNTIAKWIKRLITKEKQVEVMAADPRIWNPDTPTEVLELQKELRAAQLRNKLLEAMIDIGEEQYGIELRKKPGTKRS